MRFLGDVEFSEDSVTDGYGISRKLIISIDSHHGYRLEPACGVSMGGYVNEGVPECKAVSKAQTMRKNHPWWTLSTWDCSGFAAMFETRAFQHHACQPSSAGVLVEVDPVHQALSTYIMHLIRRKIRSWGKGQECVVEAWLGKAYRHQQRF
ncbi:hypothetical protein BC830DRAFT_37057 [Chytriomyces sp. MP71]|nr:hypothetical protein BC830DRAFT_37057 [Chytriomyces sp. MP71]